MLDKLSLEQLVPEQRGTQVLMVSHQKGTGDSLKELLLA